MPLSLLAALLTLSASLALTSPLAAAGENTAAPVWGQWPQWGDQRDGTYKNPVLPSDYSDLDCIRVGADYYAISSTFQFSPGVIILHSKDLVNWRILGHVVTDLTQISPELNWDKMNRSGRGIWAGAIRHHAGKFRVYFGTPDEGYFMSTATDPAGPWEPLHKVMDSPGWDDCCPFWDDDGQGYFVGTHFKGGYKTYLFKLTPDGRDLIKDSAILINEGSRREASKLYKINGTYYHFFSEHQGALGRYVMMQRAKAITGPYTEVRQLAHPSRDAMEPNQGGLVQTEAGDWYFFTHHGTGRWEGRCASLLPVTWIDGWPILGTVGPDGLGTMAWSGKKPVHGTPVITPQTDDDFSATTLPPQWEWNYQPRAGKWSLTERPGFLRLHAFQPLKPDDLRTAGNTLTQRCFRTSDNVVTVALDLSGRADGAALTLEFTEDKKITRGPAITAKKIWLRSSWSLDGVSRYAYSVDGTTFTPFGEPYQLSWGHYRGDRIGLFTYNTKADAGHLDIDAFTYTYENPATRR